MSYITLHYYCGCGYKTDDVLEAECHCDTLMHDVSIQGIMHSSTRVDPFQAYVEKHEIVKRRRSEGWKPAIEQADRKEYHQPVQVQQVQVEIKAGFDSLRNKLKR